MKNSKQKGVSLVEMAIIIVVIGLLVAGVLQGKELIRLAQLKSVISDTEEIKAGVKEFQYKYGQLPGDFNKATTLWSSATGNGNGNGVLYFWGSEPLYFWNHLSLSGIIPYSYTGVAGTPGSNYWIYGENAPKSKLDGVGYICYQPYIGTAIVVGKRFSAGVSQPWGGVFTPKEAWWMDKKIDDGLAQSGNFRAAGWENVQASYCTDTADMEGTYDAGEDYNLDDDTQLCSVSFYFYK